MKSYPAYKDIRGSYQFDRYVLAIDHVQGDPFAAPSKVRLLVSGKQAGFDPGLYDLPWKRLALQDHILRRMAKTVREYSFQARGSGKSGLLGVSQPGQEVLDRSACVIEPENGTITLRMEIGFPANGRTINARELEKILFDFLPECVEQTLFARAYRKEELIRTAHLAEDQHYIRQELAGRGLAAFVANGSVLPRKSGVSMLPMKDAVAFRSPASLEVEFDLPHHGPIRGMGIRKGVTLIVGGGYHGKSTLLKALELGVYNHIAGDGREFVITDETAMKLRAEDGRSIRKTDISMFISNLPNGKDTPRFTTEDASGSTSQAANVVESLEAGTSLLLIDEDTSATNFMVRDELMQRVIHRDMEPITPFLERVRELYDRWGVSTILVAGSSGAYFHAADRVIQMDRYEPRDVTALAKREAAAFPLHTEGLEPAAAPALTAAPGPPGNSGMGAGSSSNPWAGTGSPSTGRPSTCGMWSSWRTGSRPPPWGSAWCTPSGASWTENETCARWWTSWRRCWTGRGWKACARAAPACPSWPGQGGRRFSPASTVIGAGAVRENSFSG